MMQLRLEPKWIRKLVSMPESGMGYHRVCVQLRDGRVFELAIVRNAEILEVADDVEFLSSDIDRIDPAAAG
jgi:hypothetical protein